LLGIAIPNEQTGKSDLDTCHTQKKRIYYYTQYSHEVKEMNPTKKISKQKGVYLLELSSSKKARLKKAKENLQQK
jgi:hypothetical protein